MIAAFLIFMGTAFRKAWTSLSTDFPNYYTAAVLVRHGEPLRNYYEWTWFARQMNYAGIENQLGANTTQTPLTMLPMVPLSRLLPQTAKRVWLVFNLALVAAIVGLLAGVTLIRWEYITLLLFCGYRSVETNFVYGQYYIVLLFLITIIICCVERHYDGAGGLVAGIAFGLKLYTGPMLIYFAAKRKWRSVVGMAVAAVSLTALAIVLFGWRDVSYYSTHILPQDTGRRLD
jgi:hypothetical protein